MRHGTVYVLLKQELELFIYYQSHSDQSSTEKYVLRSEQYDVMFLSWS